MATRSRVLALLLGLPLAAPFGVPGSPLAAPGARGTGWHPVASRPRPPAGSAAATCLCACPICVRVWLHRYLDACICISISMRACMHIRVRLARGRPYRGATAAPSRADAA